MKVTIDTEKTYTQMEFAKKTGHSRSTIQDWIKKGKLKVVKVIGTILIQDK